MHLDHGDVKGVKRGGEGREVQVGEGKPTQAHTKKRHAKDRFRGESRIWAGAVFYQGNSRKEVSALAVSPPPSPPHPFWGVGGQKTLVQGVPEGCLVPAEQLLGTQPALPVFHAHAQHYANLVTVRQIPAAALHQPLQLHPIAPF